jgi:hypothetical protein
MKFHEKFLKPKLYAYMTAERAFPRSPLDYGQPLGYSGSARYQVAVRIPRFCVGCGAPTPEAGSKKFPIALRYLRGTSRISVTLQPEFAIPVCSACAPYGFFDHVSMSSNVVGNIPRQLFIVFRFPNVAYYRHFREANDLDPGDWITRNPVFPKQKPGDIEAVEQLLDVWTAAETFGFHRYLAIKGRLLALEGKYSWFNRKKKRAQIEAELDGVMRDLALSTEDLRKVRGFMNEKVKSLDMVLGPGVEPEG